MQIEGKRAKRSLALLKINNMAFGMLAGVSSRPPAEIA